MIHTDGIRTIAHRPPVLGQVTQAELDALARARELREAALDKAFGKPGSVTKIDLDPEIESAINRGPQANGQQWNDDACACGGEIADSPAGDKCWDCFNFDPSDES